MVKDGPGTCGEGGLVVKDGLDTDDLAVRWSCGRDDPFTSLVVLARVVIQLSPWLR